ncbi:fimbrial protein [Pseudomonas chlororaphis]|uniref:fimbrial protein n=1 Tax=Pseudomonas chlororaphis TaxID=587753 RepID=UPI000F56D3E3|nr:fimbrial protein [Pseudomonas chlororaphis]AZC50506.1 putative fimbrial protein [Pseudomonas chlororaphis subsp. piscium]AZC57083.1 putative fimbrial protein [Pseudomonas chlororaphis subsp. piscium]AZC75715.1 putative fimbrial protein [Pseudomonas chlororaphis subsp. piscium]MBP5059147.1 type 1 fimbrial protein [Pseudomonas chlororaphis]MBP5143976.1 type 1 fimbrial protein [Pseudomonas chlororaphis]
MNRKALAFAVLVSATGAQFANAADGTINFNGQLTATTCTVAVDGAANSTAAVVTLPTVSTNALQTSGQTTGQTGFNITLANCSGTAQTAAAFFEAGPGVDQASGQLLNSAAAGVSASNVRLQLVDLGNNAIIRAGNTEQRTTAFRNRINYATAGVGTAPGSNGSANLPYAVRYIASGPTTAGTVVSTVTYAIDYQ